MEFDGINPVPCTLYNIGAHPGLLHAGSLGFFVTISPGRSLRGRLKIGPAPDCCTGNWWSAPYVEVLNGETRSMWGDPIKRPVVDAGGLLPDTSEWTNDKLRNYGYYSLACGILSYLITTGKGTAVGMDRDDRHLCQIAQRVPTAKYVASLVTFPHLVEQYDGDMRRCRQYGPWQRDGKQCGGKITKGNDGRDTTPLVSVLIHTSSPYGRVPTKRAGVPTKLYQDLMEKMSTKEYLDSLPSKTWNHF